MPKDSDVTDPALIKTGNKRRYVRHILRRFQDLKVSQKEFRLLQGIITGKFSKLEQTEIAKDKLHEKRISVKEQIAVIN